MALILDPSLNPIPGDIVQCPICTHYIHPSSNEVTIPCPNEHVLCRTCCAKPETRQMTRCPICRGNIRWNLLRDEFTGEVEDMETDDVDVETMDEEENIDLRPQSPRVVIEEIDEVVHEAQAHGPAAAANRVNPPLNHPRRKNRRPRAVPADGRRCIGIKKNGDRCSNPRLGLFQYCSTHCTSKVTAGTRERIRDLKKTTDNKIVRALIVQQTKLAAQLQKVDAIEQDAVALKDLTIRNNQEFALLQQRGNAFNSMLNEILSVTPGATNSSVNIPRIQQ